MGLRTRPLQTGDFVKIRLRPYTKKPGSSFANFDESRAYEVTEITRGFEDMFYVAGFDVPFYEDEAIEIVNDDVASDQFYDSSEALTDFLGLFAVGKEG